MSEVSHEAKTSLPADVRIRKAIDEKVIEAESYPSTIGCDDSFFVCDLSEVKRLHDRWKAHLPDVVPFYAVKCNADPKLLRALAKLGTGFDCASVEEMRAVLRLGVHASRIVFANPCKSSWSLTYAKKVGIFRTTFDNLDELEKVRRHMPNAQLMLRIYANDDGALIALGEKYGAPVHSARALLLRARELCLDVVGVSFHIGTGAIDPGAMHRAVADAREVWDLAETIGFRFTILDVGGGFSPSEAAFRPMAQALTTAIAAASFPPDTVVMAEPGRFFARSVFTLVCRVIARRRSAGVDDLSQREMLYQNDGVYGNFMNALIEKEKFSPRLVMSATNSHIVRRTDSHSYMIWGPTCDSTDLVASEVCFSEEVLIGDWLVYGNMGAYTSTTTTRFNGFPNDTQTVYI